MKRKDKMLKAFKGAQADANKGQAMSPGTGATGGTRGRGRDPSAQFSGNNNLSQKNKNALSAQMQEQLLVQAQLLEIKLQEQS
jgi:hypothetical protein